LEQQALLLVAYISGDLKTIIAIIDIIKKWPSYSHGAEMFHIIESSGFDVT
jgi:hypothetical protein